MRKTLAFALALLSTTALAADNGIIWTPGAGGTSRSKDVGVGVQVPGVFLTDQTGTFPGAFVNYGSNPGAVLVPAMNAFVTNSPTVAQGSPPWTVNPGTAASWGVQTQGSTTSGQSGVLNQAAVTTASPSYTTGQTSPLSLDLAGNLRVNVVAGGAPGGTSSTYGAAFPGTGTASGFTDGTNMVAGRVTTYGTAPTGFNALAVNAFVTNTNANGQATMANSSPVTLASNQSVADPCTFQLKTSVNINTATGTTGLVVGVSAKKIYVCSFAIVAPTAVAVSLSEGSSATCGTSAQAGVMGVATNGTAANGMSFAANGGLTYGNGNATVAVTATAANALCLFQSGTAQLAGNLTYVQQ